MRYILLIFLLYAACGQPERYIIEEGTQNPDQYITLLKEVNSLLDEDPEDVDLIYRKLYLSQKLRWPEDLSTEITYLISRRSFDFELYNYATDFYKSTHRYEKLLNILDKWNESYPVSRQDTKLRVMAFTGLKREMEAKQLLWELLQQSEKPEDLNFIATEYMKMEDTARAVYAFSRLARQNPVDPILLDLYIPVLIRQGYPGRARELLLLQSQDDETFEKQYFLAKALFELNESRQAIDLLRKFDNSTGNLQIAQWYRDLKSWDSAMYYTNKVLQEDSTREAFFLKGTIFEQRGWLNSAYSVFNDLIQIDSADSISFKRAEIVSRKIAYLRRKREEEKSIPVLEIPSLKSTDNE